MAFHAKTELRAAFAEWIATTFLVFFGCGSVCATVASGAPAVTDYALAFGITITCAAPRCSNIAHPQRCHWHVGDSRRTHAAAIPFTTSLPRRRICAFAVGDVSGAHINPAVTLSMMLTRNTSPARGAIYMVAQFFGGLTGGALLRAAVMKDAYNSGLGMNPAITVPAALLFEVMGTTLLIFTIFNVAIWAGGAAADAKGASDVHTSTISALAPIPIGLAVVVAHLVLGPFTGCGINPARALGAAVYQQGFWDTRAGENFWVYMVGPLIASLLGPALYAGMYGAIKIGGSDIKQSSTSPA